MITFTNNLLIFKEIDLLNFFKKYPFRTFYRDYHSITVDNFAQFHLERLKYEFKKANFKGFVIYNSSNTEILAILGFEFQRNSSSIQNLNHYDINIFYNYIFSEATNSILIELINNYCQEHKIEYLTVHPDAHDYESVNFFQNSLQFKYFAGTYRVIIPLPKKKLTINESYNIRLATKNDINELIKLAVIHNQNQIFYETRISQDHGKKIFLDWLQKYLERPNTKTLIIETKDYEIIGFTCWDIPVIFNRVCEIDICTNDFTVIKKEYQGKGIGKYLLSEMMFLENRVRMEGKVMTNNYQSIKLLQSLGGIIASNDTWFSRWMTY